MLFIEVSSFLLLSYLRYNNQGLLLEEIEFFKTGNLISTIFFSVIFILISINFFSNSDLKNTTLVTLILIAAGSLFFLFVFGSIFSKDDKVYFTFAFILGNIFILLSLLRITFSRTKKLYPGRNVFYSVVILAIAIFIIFLQIYNYQDDSGKYTKNEKIADAGIIFGAAVWGGNRPSPVLRERINKGYEVYEKNYVPLLVLTGSGAPEEMAESEVARNELLKYGVKRNDLIIENVTYSTFEQITFVRDNLYRRRNWKSIIVISDNYHLYRINEMCKFNDMNAITFSTETPLSTQGGILFCLRESVAVLMYWVLGFG